MKIFKISVLLFIVVGCSHSMTIKKIQTEKTSATVLANKTVAIVINSDDFPDESKSSVAAHTYHFKGQQKRIVNALRVKLGNTVKDVKIFIDEEPNGVYDFYFYPEVTIKMVDDFFTLACLINYRLKISNNSMKSVVAEEKGKKSFFAVSEEGASEGCTDQLGILFEKVTMKAIISIGNP